MKDRRLWLGLAAACAIPVAFLPRRAPADGEALIQERPKYVTPAIEKSITKGLNWLKSHQSGNGSWSAGGGGYGAYPTAMTGLAGMALLGSGSTPTRGKYSKAIARCVDFLVNKCARSDGLIIAPNENSRSMYGHGFSMMFLASVYGMESDRTRQQKIKVALKKGIKLIARAQSQAGGWYYTPESGADEGSVTVTEVQALRACRNSGLMVSPKVIKGAIRYIEASVCPDGGIAYSAGGGGSRPPITAAAVAVLYNAGGKYDSPMTTRALEYCKKRIAIDGGGGFWGHYFYSHLYMSQAMYQSGDKNWRWYYPKISRALINRQAGDGSWSDSGIGKVYGTAISLTILQLPYEFVPIYAR